LRFLKKKTPISDAFEIKSGLLGYNFLVRLFGGLLLKFFWNTLKSDKYNTGYEDQGEHWDSWLSEYDGPGYYNRKTHNRTSEFIYNHIKCPPMFTWLAENLEIPKDVLKNAIKESLKSTNLQSQSGAIRKYIPWEMIRDKLIQL
jgi:hypothetical protein